MQTFDQQKLDAELSDEGRRNKPYRDSLGNWTVGIGHYLDAGPLPATGRSILVRINDRGPYAGGRILDLSREAARRLGTIPRGVARVCISAPGSSGQHPASENAQ
jgi:rare lipoprotein A